MFCDFIRKHDIQGVQIEFTIANSIVEYVREQGLELSINYIYAVVTNPDIAKGLYDISNNLFHMYGQTEAGHPLATKIEPPFDDRPTLGKPTARSDIRIVPTENVHGEIPVKAPDPGDEGELLVRSEGSMNHYLDDDKQENLVYEDWIYTGDILGINEDNELYFIGRSDDRIRSGGVNIYPSEIERVLSQFPGVDDSIVVGVEDEKWGEKICALVLYKGEMEESQSIEELDEYCKKHEGLTRQMRPREYIVISSAEEIPTGAQDKVDREAVERLFNNR
jgi:acyl-CoA synthetase (AMP-forming)/AMP-acid ligase II